MMSRKGKCHRLLPRKTLRNSHRLTTIVRSNRVPQDKKKSEKDNLPLAPHSRPPKRVVKINDTPRNVARSYFGIRSTKFPRPKE